MLSVIYLLNQFVSGRFFEALLWPLKRVWRVFVVKQMVPAVLGAKVAVLWPALFILAALLESAVAGLLFFYLFFASAVSSSGTAVSRIDRLVLPFSPTTLSPWYQQPTAQPYNTIGPHDVELAAAPEGVRRAPDNPHVTYYSTYPTTFAPDAMPLFVNPGA